MASPLESLEPRLLWQHFDEIRMVPRPSKHEERIAKHVSRWAEGKGFEVRRDRAGNLVIAVPATPGNERSPVVVLQGHLDMVPEKNQDVSFDFLTDPIQVRVEGDYVLATGTTLGSDNGIGVAAAMAVAEDPNAAHGPLELLLTVDEETGLTGAMQLDPDMVKGRILLNLDTEEEGAVYIGCAGGADTSSRFAITRQQASTGTVPLAIEVRGLRGGHSGIDVQDNRANAIKVLARALSAARGAGVELEVVSISGGSKHNAIPREADAVVRVPQSQETLFRQTVEATAAVMKEEFQEVDPNARMEVKEAEDGETTSQVWLHGDRDRVVGALLACPHGVLGMSRAVAGLVETSNNLAVLESNGGDVKVTTAARSSVMPTLRAVSEQVAAVFRLAGAEVESHGGYPGWKPDRSSPILKTTMAVHEREFGAAPEVKAIHAGLECGLIGEKLPGIDMISIGPQIESPHSPDERVKISTVATFYRLLKAVLAEVA